MPTRSRSGNVRSVVTRANGLHVGFAVLLRVADLGTLLQKPARRVLCVSLSLYLFPFAFPLFPLIPFPFSLLHPVINTTTTIIIIIIITIIYPKQLSVPILLIFVYAHILCNY